MADYYFTPTVGSAGGAGTSGDPFRNVSTVNTALAAGSLSGGRLLISAADVPALWVPDARLLMHPNSSGVEVRSESDYEYAPLCFARDLSAATWTLVTGNVYSTPLSTTSNYHANVIVFEYTDYNDPSTWVFLEPVQGSSLPTLSAAGQYWVNNSTGLLYVRTQAGGSPFGQKVAASVNTLASTNLNNGSVGLMLDDGQNGSGVTSNNAYRRLKVWGCGNVAPANITNCSGWTVGSGNYAVSTLKFIGGTTVLENMDVYHGANHTIGFTSLSDGVALVMNNVRVRHGHPTMTTDALVITPNEGATSGSGTIRLNRVDVRRAFLTGYRTTTAATNSSNQGIGTHAASHSHTFELLELNECQTESIFATEGTTVAATTRVNGGSMTTASSWTSGTLTFNGVQFRKFPTPANNSAGAVFNSCSFSPGASEFTDIRGTYQLLNCLVDMRSYTTGNAPLNSAGYLASAALALTVKNCIFIGASSNDQKVIARLRADEVAAWNGNWYYLVPHTAWLYDSDNNGSSNGTQTLATWKALGFDSTPSTNSGDPITYTDYSPTPDSPLLFAGASASGIDGSRVYYTDRSTIGAYNLRGVPTRQMSFIRTDTANATIEFDLYEPGGSSAYASLTVRRGSAMYKRDDGEWMVCINDPEQISGTRWQLTLTRGEIDGANSVRVRITDYDSPKRFADVEADIGIRAIESGSEVTAEAIFQYLDPAWTDRNAAEMLAAIEAKTALLNFTGSGADALLKTNVFQWLTVTPLALTNQRVQAFTIFSGDGALVVTVLVEDEDGNPLMGASVRASGPTSAHGTSDADGQVVFGLNAGSYTFTATHGGSSADPVSQEISDASEVSLVITTPDISLPSDPSKVVVYGVYRESNGDPVPNGTFSYRLVTPPADLTGVVNRNSIEVACESDGSFEVEVLKDAVYYFRASNSTKETTVSTDTDEDRMVLPMVKGDELAS